MRDTEHAAIAQQVERILGKDEVSSSNLDSSSTKKARNRKVSGLFLFSIYKRAVFSCYPGTHQHSALAKIYNHA